MRLLLPFLLVVLICADWSQLGGDAFHSYAMKVTGNPPPAQTITFPAPDDCIVTQITNLILTSSGRIIGSSYCPFINRKYNYPHLLFSYKESENPKTWTQKLNFREYNKIWPIVMSGKGQSAFSYEHISAFGSFPFKIDPENGTMWDVKGSNKSFFFNSRILSPGSDSIFLIQTRNEILYTKNLTFVPSGYKYNVSEPEFSGLVSDPTGPRVAFLVGSDFPGKQYERLIVLDVHVQGDSVKLKEEWSLDLSYPTSGYHYFSTPAFSRDGRLFILGTPSREEVTLFIINGTTTKPQQITLHVDNFVKRNDLSITYNGKYALLHGYDGEFYIVSTIDATYARKKAVATAIDDARIVYGVYNCQLFAFCLNNFEVNVWNTTICTGSQYAQALVLGKYAGGQRRLFVGFANIPKVTPIMIIDPPSISCN